MFHSFSFWPSRNYAVLLRTKVHQQLNGSECRKWWKVSSNSTTTSKPGTEILQCLVLVTTTDLSTVRTFGVVSMPCIYSHARWEWQQVIQVCVVVSSWDGFRALTDSICSLLRTSKVRTETIGLLWWQQLGFRALSCCGDGKLLHYNNQQG